MRNGARANTRKLLILLTDGVQTKQRGYVDPTLRANELRKMGVTVSKGISFLPDMMITSKGLYVPSRKWLKSFFEKTSFSTFFTL